MGGPGNHHSIYLDKSEKQYKVLCTSVAGTEERLLKLSVPEAVLRGNFIKEKIMTKTSLLLGRGDNPTMQIEKKII